MPPYAASVADLTDLNTAGEKHVVATAAHRIVVKQHSPMRPGLYRQFRYATVLGVMAFKFRNPSTTPLVCGTLIPTKFRRTLSAAQVS